MAILDPSEASLFRSGEAWKPFMCIDEFYRVGPEIERILRAAYKKGPKVPRVEKSKAGIFYLGLFDFYSKVAIATPEPVPSNILDKGITITMRRMPDPHPEKRDPKPEDFDTFRSQVYIARLSWAPRIKTIASALDKEKLGLSGRDYEVWKAPLTMAKLFGGDVWKNVLSYAKESTADKAEASDEELKNVLQAIFELVKEKDAKTTQSKLKAAGEANFPIEFTPKTIHDRIWERLKDDYRTIKSKQEVRGEVTEGYDYDTRRFERVYSPVKVGRTYLQQLGLKSRHGKSGSFYKLSTGTEFHELVLRYDPALPGETDFEKQDYARVLGIPESTVTTVTSVTDPSFEREIKTSNGDRSSSGDGNTVTKEAPVPSDSNPVTPSSSVTLDGSQNKRENRPGDSGDSSDGYSQVIKLPYVEIGRCSRCGVENVPLRLDVHGQFLQCSTCYDELSKRVP